jgi:predicted  nucleic acid-binding Zn-ribbon protein
MLEPKTFTQEELDAELKKAKDGILAELSTERENRRKFEADLKAMKDEFEKVKSEQEKTVSEKEKTELLAQGKYEEALKKYQDETQAVISKKEQAIAELKATITKYRVDNQIMEAAGEAINPKQVTTLIKDGYELIEKPDGTIEVLNASDKTPVLNNSTGKPVNLKELTEIFLAENKHLVKPGAQQGGAGSQQGGTRNYEPAGNDYDAQIKQIRDNPNLAEAEKRHEIIKIKARRSSSNLVGIGGRNTEQSTLDAVRLAARSGG